MAWISKNERLRLTRLGQSGDKEARSKVILSVSGMVNSIAMKYCRSFGLYGQLDEIFQIGMASVAVDFDKIDTHKKIKGRIINPMTYLVSNARWRMLAHCRLDGLIRRPDGGRAREKRDVPLNSTIDDFDINRLPDCGDDDIEKNESSKVISEAIARLPKKMRHVVRSVIMDDDTLRETGQRLGISKERVRQIKVKALEELRSDMKLIQHFVT